MNVPGMHFPHQTRKIFPTEKMFARTYPILHADNAETKAELEDPINALKGEEGHVLNGMDEVS
jgi:hypothetical protein